MSEELQWQEENDKIQKKDKKGEMFEWIEMLIFSMASVILIFIFFFRLVEVKGPSMIPTLYEGNRLVISDIGFTPKYGDVVVITQPNYRNETLIKRVIATENQEIDIDFEKGIVYVDGQALDEPYINEPTLRSYDITFPQTVPKGCVFVMGDNRNVSLDSRDSQIGMIDTRYLLGKVVLRLSPINKFGKVK